MHGIYLPELVQIRRLHPVEIRLHPPSRAFEPDERIVVLKCLCDRFVQFVQVGHIVHFKGLGECLAQGAGRLKVAHDLVIHIGKSACHTQHAFCK